jgi:hypothetical protein
MFIYLFINVLIVQYYIYSFTYFIVTMLSKTQARLPFQSQYNNLDIPFRAPCLRADWYLWKHRLADLPANYSSEDY